jgi:hypothetical protein
MKAFKQFYGWFVIFSVVIYLAYLVAVLAHLPSDMFHFCSFIVAAFMAVLLSASVFLLFFDRRLAVKGLLVFLAECVASFFLPAFL